MTGELKPKMPPNGAIDLERIGIIRRWIDEGAKVDSMVLPASSTGGKGTARTPLAAQPAIVQAAPVTSLAFSPDGTHLAVGGYRAVRLLDPATGAALRTIPGPVDQVQSLAWSSDGKYLAAAGGVPGKSGEILLFDTKGWKAVRTLTGHTEVVYAVAWKPSSMELASGSLDKTVRIWDAASGNVLRILKDHADPVFSVAYSPDGKLFASASGDRTCKLFDTNSWKRTDTLSAHQDAVLHVAFNKDGSLLATVGADKQMKIWKVVPGKIENPLRNQGEGEAINSCAFSPDGSLLVWGASNSMVKLFNGDGSNQRRELKDAKDWVYCVAVRNDNDTVAAGTQEGKVYLWSAKDGKLRLTVTLLPTGAKVETVSETRK
jgi:WD40 repeat protein